MIKGEKVWLESMYNLESDKNKLLTLSKKKVVIHLTTNFVHLEKVVLPVCTTMKIEPRSKVT